MLAWTPRQETVTSLRVSFALIMTFLLSRLSFKLHFNEVVHSRGVVFLIEFMYQPKTGDITRKFPLNHFLKFDDFFLIDRIYMHDVIWSHPKKQIFNKLTNVLIRIVLPKIRNTFKLFLKKMDTNNTFLTYVVYKIKWHH